MFEDEESEALHWYLEDRHAVRNALRRFFVQQSHGCIGSICGSRTAPRPRPLIPR
jgi:hypothetical protein